MPRRRQGRPLAGAARRLTVAPGQREALRLAVASKALVITGVQGVGKTTLVNANLKVPWLNAQLRSLKSRFILTINDCPGARALFDGFCIETVGASCGVGIGAKAARELIVSN